MAEKESKSYLMTIRPSQDNPQKQDLWNFICNEIFCLECKAEVAWTCEVSLHVMLRRHVGVVHDGPWCPRKHWKWVRQPDNRYDKRVWEFDWNTALEVVTWPVFTWLSFVDPLIECSKLCIRVDNQVNKLKRSRHLPARGTAEQEPTCAVQIWSPNCIVPLQTAQVQVSAKLLLDVSGMKSKATTQRQLCLWLWHSALGICLSPPSCRAACGHAGDRLSDDFILFLHYGPTVSVLRRSEHFLDQPLSRFLAAFLPISALARSSGQFLGSLHSVQLFFFTIVTSIQPGFDHCVSTLVLWRHLLRKAEVMCFAGTFFAWFSLDRRKWFLSESSSDSRM